MAIEFRNLTVYKRKFWWF